MGKWLVCALALAGTLPAWAATRTVTSINDSGPGSLRAAITSAVSGDTIRFSLPASSTITLMSMLTLSSNITINGPGAAQLAISGNHKVPPFLIKNGATDTISGIAVENGSPLGISVQGTLTLINSMVSGNAGPLAGGILNEGTLTLINSTVSGNFGSSEGGGIASGVGALTLTNSTISGNSAPSGGGIASRGSLIINNSTVSGNSAATGGGISSLGAYLSIKNTLLVNNKGGNCDFNDSITSQGYNLSDDTSCGKWLTAAGDKNNIAAGLDPNGLQNNAGSTPTIALLPASPAVDAIPVADCTDADGAAITTDQRGISRPRGDGCDIGAFELAATAPFSNFSARLSVSAGQKVGGIIIEPPNFLLIGRFTLGDSSKGINPLTEAVTLTIGSYGVTLPAGSFQQSGSGGYVGYAPNLRVTINLPVGDSYSFTASGSPIPFTVTSPIPVTLTIGPDTGTTKTELTGWSL